MRKLSFAIITLLIVGLASLLPFSSQLRTTVAYTSAYAQDGEMPTADEVNEVAREIWCPLCAGVRLDSCELTACKQMKEEIALKLSQGEDTESIKTYFLNQYGPQILGEPPREGFNWLAWILPFAVLIVGGVYMVMSGRRMVAVGRAANTQTMVESGAESGIESGVESGAMVETESVENGSDESDGTGQEKTETNKYTKQLDEELRLYE
ncbi:MAG: cytochrome c-type biogenesis protein CcmH [Chloroflexota bacterium]